eukprot:6486461-Amphidinium_carterae.1
MSSFFVHAIVSNSRLKSCHHLACNGLQSSGVASLGSSFCSHWGSFVLTDILFASAHDHLLSNLPELGTLRIGVGPHLGSTTLSVLDLLDKEPVWVILGECKCDNFTSEPILEALHAYFCLLHTRCSCGYVAINNTMLPHAQAGTSEPGQTCSGRRLVNAIANMRTV